jgi:hypothetical protein
MREKSLKEQITRVEQWHELILAATPKRLTFYFACDKGLFVRNGSAL